MSTENPKPRRTRCQKGRLTPELADELIGHLERGLPKNTAAAMVGISKQLLNLWLAQGNAALEKDPNSRDKYAEFALRVETACARYQASLLAKLDQSITDKKVDHRPLKYLLAVRFPKEFAHQPQVAGTTKQDEDSPETVTAEEATLSVAAKIAEYLKANPLDDQPAASAAPEASSGE